MAQNTQSHSETTLVRALVSDTERMDRLAPKLEKRSRGASYKRPGVITAALDALEKEFSNPAETQADA